MLVILMFTLLYAMKTGDLYWSILILLIYNSKRAKIEEIYKISLNIIVIGIISVFILCVVGILPDVLTTRNTVEQINYNRHSFGFYHSNVLPLLVFYLEVYYICIKKKKCVMQCWLFCNYRKYCEFLLPFKKCFNSLLFIINVCFLS